MKTFSNKSIFIPSNRAIGILFDAKNSFIAHYVLPWAQGNERPSVVPDESIILVLHGLNPRTKMSQYISSILQPVKKMQKNKNKTNQSSRYIGRYWRYIVDISPILTNILARKLPKSTAHEMFYFIQYLKINFDIVKS